MIEMNTRTFPALIMVVAVALFDAISHARGKLDKAWDEAVAKGWTVGSMKDDWKTMMSCAPK
jgi:hypothetical protein